MAICFVIQPFDKGRFDKRYEDIYGPAITGAGLDPYRVDRDPGVTIPIEDIQSGIESSEVCLADISTDNPNVWFELGYAIASHREVVLLCSDERESRFPFDVQHRSIIGYSTESARDFEQLKSEITARLKALLAKRDRLGHLGSIPSVARFEGLEQYEIAALVAVAEESVTQEDGRPTHLIRQDMEKAGFTKLAATLGLRSLLQKEMVKTFEDHDYNDQPFTAYALTDAGVTWLLKNQDKLTLKREPPASDDIPF